MKRTAAVMLLVYVAVTVNAQSPQTLPPAPPAYGSPSTLDQAKKALDDQGLSGTDRQGRRERPAPRPHRGQHARGRHPDRRRRQDHRRIGVSGVTSAQDAQIAQAGIDALKK